MTYMYMTCTHIRVYAFADMFEVSIQCSKQHVGNFQQKSVTMHSQDSFVWLMLCLCVVGSQSASLNKCRLSVWGDE